MSVISRLFSRKDEGFGERFARALRSDPRVKRVEWNKAAGELVITRADSTTDTINLTNAELEYARCAEELHGAFVERWVELAFAGPGIPESWDEAASLLLPQLRPDDVPTVWRLEALARGNSMGPLAWRPLVDGLGAAFVIDHPARMAFVPESQVESWGVGADELLETALDNLRARTPQPPQRMQNGFYGSPYEDCYDASRLLLPEWVGAVPTRGRRLVAAPTRDQVLIGEVEEAAALLHEAETVSTSGARPISSCVFVHDGSRLSRFEVAPHDSLHPLVRRSELIDAANRYGEQVPILERLHERERLDVHVAKLMVFEHPERGLHSVCTWIKGVPGWLPRADDAYLLCRPDDKEGFPVAWRDLVRVVGHRMKPIPDLVPPRWSVESFPDDAELQVLRTAGGPD